MRRVDWRTSSTPSDVYDLTKDAALAPRMKGGIHTEWVLDSYEKNVLSGAEDTLDGLSERIPCLSRGNRCRTSLADRTILPSLREFRYLTTATNLDQKELAARKKELNHEVQQGKMTPAEARAKLESEDAASYTQGANRRWRDAGQPTTPESVARLATAAGSFAVPGAPASGGAATAALSGEPGSDPGGIDFSTLQLRYLAEDPNGQLHYAYSASAATSPDHRITAGQIAAGQMSDAFFVWLNLPTSTFWVNLNPREADRIIDPKLAGTDVGRVLLQADLRMKKLAARLTNPNTETGRQFWGPPNPATARECGVTRQWIVPRPAEIYEDNGGLYIISAPLEVKSESEEFNGTTGDPACPVPSRRMESVFERLILPKVEDAVNHAPDFAELRRVYLSRVAAQWYRQRGTGALADMIDSGDVSRWQAATHWSPRQVFDDYVKSYKQGEYHTTKEVVVGSIRYRFSYTDGGVDFGTVPFQQVPRATFEQDHPGLASTVGQSFDKVSTDRQGTRWLGDSADTSAAVDLPSGDPQKIPDDEDAPAQDAVHPGWMRAGVAGAVVVLLAVVVLVLLRRRRARSRRFDPYKDLYQPYQSR
jgi:hypothetical protein